MVSIIVPVYNAANYIEKTIEMVRAQTFSDWELLLVDDASLDNSVEKIENFLQRYPDSRIILLKNKKNEGAAFSRNQGTKAAKGRYIAFLDADDIWLSDKLEKQLSFMKDKEAGFVFTAYEFGDEKAVGTGKIVHVPPGLSYEEALSRTVIFTTTVLIDTKKIEKELLLMPQVPSEDSATWWQILRKGHIAQGMDEVTAIYRRPSRSLSSNKLKAMKRIWYLYRKVEKLPFMKSCLLFTGWALRATLRRI